MEENKPEKKSGWRGPIEAIHRTGRPVGTKNRQTSEIREAYQNLVEMNLVDMSQWIRTVAETDPAKAFDLMIKLSEFVLPKLARTEVTGAGGEDLFKNLTFEFGPSVSERLEAFDIENIDSEEI